MGQDMAHCILPFAEKGHPPCWGAHVSSHPVSMPVSSWVNLKHCFCSGSWLLPIFVCHSAQNWISCAPLLWSHADQCQAAHPVREFSCISGTQHGLNPFASLTCQTTPETRNDIVNSPKPWSCLLLGHLSLLTHTLVFIPHYLLGFQKLT